LVVKNIRQTYKKAKILAITHLKKTNNVFDLLSNLRGGVTLKKATSHFILTSNSNDIVDRMNIQGGSFKLI